MDNLWSKLRDLWNDPVWSKVIATGIIALLAFLIRLFWNQIKGLWKSIFQDKTQETHRSKYLENPIFNDLFINNNNRTMYQKLHGHEPEYIRLIDDLIKDGLIVHDKAGIPSLSAKGNKWIARIRKTI